MAQSVVEYNGIEFNICYEILNPTKRESIVFLHGWGSNKELMKSSFSKILKEYKHIYIDLPGFGNSSCSVVMDSQKYLHVVELFLSSLNISYEIILGHSFGGKIATLLNPKKLILVASAGVLLPKPFSVKAKIFVSKVFNSLGLHVIKKLFLADDAKQLTPNMYETFKIVISEDFKTQFQHRKNGALLLWGDKDSATPMKSATLMSSYIKNSKLVVYSGDHYFFMKNVLEIEKEILEYVK